MKEIFLLEDFLSVMIGMILTMLVLCAGLEINFWYNYQTNIVEILKFLMNFNGLSFNLRMLGYSCGQHTQNSYFGRVNDTFGMDNVQCSGNEDTILACPHTTRHNCLGNEGAGVICKGIL